MKKLIVGNWKMNGSMEDARVLIANTINALDAQKGILAKCEMVVCLPFLHIPAVRYAIYGFPELRFGAQDCSAHDNGAHTGETSAAMLRDSSCTYVILGHSERRHLCGESDALVGEKVKTALRYDLTPILCVGETQEQRDAGQEKAVIEEQLRAGLPQLESFDTVAVAYEPVWAIGTGNVATPENILDMHAFIREQLAQYSSTSETIRILYGGSVKPDNASEILSLKNVDGALIGGASLKAEDFLAIAKAV